MTSDTDMTCEQRDACLVVRVTHKSLIASDAESAFWSRLTEITSDAVAVVLDLSAVTFLSSAALGKLISLKRKLARHERRLALCGLDKEVDAVFRVTRLDRILPIATTAEEAIGLLSPS